MFEGTREGEKKGGRYETREGKFEEEEIGGALIAADFLQGERAGLVAAGFAGARLCFCARAPFCVSGTS